MVEGKNQFQVGTFLNTPATLPIWQTLGPVSSIENGDFSKFSLNFYKREILSLMQ